MKGLVLAGGAGSRLRPLTHAGAKQLVPVANRPIVFFVLDKLADAGIRDIGVVVAPETRAEIEAAIGDGSRWGARVTYIQQDRPLGLAHAIGTARAFLGEGDFCVFLGDNLVGSGVEAVVHRFAEDASVEASILLKEVDNPSSFGVAEVDASGRVIGLEEKPLHPASKLALVGIYLFRASIFEAIDEIHPSARGELEITDAIGALLKRGLMVDAAQLDGWWIDTGKSDDLLVANDRVLEEWLVPRLLGFVDAESQVSGPVTIEAGARVVRSVVRGPAILGEGALLVDAEVGPWTSVGPRVVIERSRVERSVLLEGSRIADIPHVRDSLIGRRVVVHPKASGHGVLSLFLGDDCRVEVPR